MRGGDVVEVDVVDDVVAYLGDDLFVGLFVDHLAQSLFGAVEGLAVTGLGELGCAVVEAQHGHDVGGHVGLARGLLHIVEGVAECAIVVGGASGLVPSDVVGVKVLEAVDGVVEVHVVVIVFHQHLERLHGAVALQGDALVEEVVAAVDGVVDHYGAAEFHAGVYHGELAQVVEAAAVGALLGELVDEGVLRHIDAGAVFLDGVHLVDGELFEVGVVDDEGLALAGIGYEVAGAEDLHLVAVVEVAAAVGVEGPLVVYQLVVGVGLLGSYCCAYKDCHCGKQYLFHGFT